MELIAKMLLSSFAVTQSSHMILIKKLGVLYFRFRKREGRKPSIRNIYFWTTSFLGTLRANRPLLTEASSSVWFWVNENIGLFLYTSFSCIKDST